MSKSNPFRTRRLQPPNAISTDPNGFTNAPSTLTSTASTDLPSQSRSAHHNVDVIASAFFGPESDESSSATSAHHARHDRPHKTVRIASPPVSAEGLAAGSDSGLPTPTVLSPVLESTALTTTDTAASSAAVAAGHSFLHDRTEERLVQRDPNAPFQNLTPRPGSPPPEPIADPYDTADAAAIKDINAAVWTKEKQDENQGQKQEGASVFDAVASTMERTTSLRRPKTRPPPPSTRGQRHTMDVDSFKRMLLTGDAPEVDQEKAANDQAPTQKKSGGMDVDDFKRMLLTGDPSGHADGPPKEQPSSKLQTPAVPLPRRTASTRQKLASSEDSRKTSGTITTSGNGDKPPPPPPPPRARHGRAVSMKDPAASTTSTTSDDSRRRSVGLSRSISVHSASSSISTGTATSNVPSPPPRRLRSTALEADQTLPSQQPTVSSPLQNTINQMQSPPISRSPSILSSIDEPPHEYLSTPLSDEQTKSARHQGQKMPPPTPPVARRTSQYRRSTSGSNGSVTTTATVQTQQRTALPPPPPSPRPKARAMSGSSLATVSDEDVVEAGLGTASSRSSSLSLGRVGQPPLPPPPVDEGQIQQLLQQKISPANVPEIPSASVLSENQITSPPSTSSSNLSKRQSLPPRPPPRRRPGATSSTSQAPAPPPARTPSSSTLDDPTRKPQQKTGGIDPPSRPRNSYSDRRTSGGSYSKGPPPPPPPSASQAAATGRPDVAEGDGKGEGNEVGYTSPSHAADVLADLTRLQAEVDAYRMKSAT